MSNVRYMIKVIIQIMTERVTEFCDGHTYENYNSKSYLNMTIKILAQSSLELLFFLKSL